MNTEDRDTIVRELLKQMREKLATASPVTQEATYSHVLYLSRMVDTLMQTPVCESPKPSQSKIDLTHLLPEGQGPEMTIEQIEAMQIAEKWREMQPVWQPLVDVLKGDAP
jgi:hypothetical protein